MFVKAGAQHGHREGGWALPAHARLSARVWKVGALLSILVALLVPGGLSAQPPPTIRIEMVEFAFRPAVIRLAAGRPVRLLFANNGQIAHQIEAPYLRRVPATVVGPTLRVEAGGLDVVRVDPAASARVEFVPRAVGRFPFACTIEGHQEAGMRGYLEIR
jgi:uncharacterized cupredoxin-like copper-binding protein